MLHDNRDTPTATSGTTNPLGDLVSACAPTDPGSDEKAVVADEDVEKLVLDALTAATGPCDLDAVEREVNGHELAERAYVPRGRVEKALSALASREGARVRSVMLGEPQRPHWLLTAEAEANPPEDARERRRAVVAVLGMRLSYLPRDTGGDPSHEVHMSAFQIADALERARQAHHDGPVLDASDVEAFFRGVDVTSPDDVEAAVDRVLTALIASERSIVERAPLILARQRAGSGAESGDTAKSGHIGWDDVARASAQAPDAPPNGEAKPTGPAPLYAYRLTTEAQAAFTRGGADAVVAHTLPVVPTATTAEAAAKVDARVKAARAESEAEAATMRQVAEREAARRLEAERRRDALEGWFKAQKLDPDKVLAASGVKTPEPKGEVFDFEVEVELTGEDLKRACAELSMAKTHLEQTIAKNKDAKKALDAAEAAARGVFDSLQSVVMSAGQGVARRVVKKRAYTEVRHGRIITLSADPHDYGTVLEERPIATQDQLTIGGTGTAGPRWTPEATPPSEAKHTEMPPAPAATEPAAAPKPVDPPAVEPLRFSGPIELTLKGVVAIATAYFKAVPAGCLEGEVEAKLAAYAGIEPANEAWPKLVAKALKAMKKVDLAFGEGGSDTLLWLAEYPDPREAAFAEKAAGKGAPVPAGDFRPEAVKKADAEKAKGAKKAKAKAGHRSSPGKAGAGSKK